ncbi:MAG: LacI family DNA-binding transcriptional regulator [Lachnospiraceae bacterium]|nr:LacI family DNA-binding transcriptional regulator [Lachnospiraceae bacterium]
MAVMKDVAKLAGVSVSTVSFVLNGIAKERKVSPETAKRVMQAARDLGYQINSPNVLRSGQMNIALFLPADSIMVDMDVITAGINAHIKKCGKVYNVLLCLYERGQLSQRIRSLSPSEYHAAVIMAESEADLTEFERLPANLPLVLFNGVSQTFSSVSCELLPPIDQAVRIISAKGYRNILIITGTDDKSPENYSLRLLFQCCHNFGIELTYDNCFSTENTLQGGAIAARHILNMSEKPELVITMNTTLAFGAIPLLARNHFIFTQDAELLSFGRKEDTSHIINYIPSLSLIAVPTEDITVECFSIALQLAENRLPSPVHYTCPSSLMLNESFTI